MALPRMDNVAVVVDDLDAAVAFFTELGMEPKGGGEVEGASPTRPSGSRARAAGSP